MRESGSVRIVRDCTREPDGCGSPGKRGVRCDIGCTVGNDMRTGGEFYRPGLGRILPRTFTSQL
jgi:hypothetical protein